MSDELKIVTIPRDLYYHEVAYVCGLEKKVEALEKALRLALVELFACSVQLNARKDGSIGRAIDVCRAALAEGQDRP